MPKSVKPGPDTATFRSVNTETGSGRTKKMKVPIFTGALGWMEIARKNREHRAIGICAAGQKIRTGLQQLLAGSRDFNLPTITRSGLMRLTEEGEKVTGIPCVMRACHEEAGMTLAALPVAGGSSWGQARPSI